MLWFPSGTFCSSHGNQVKIVIIFEKIGENIDKGHIEERAINIKVIDALSDCTSAVQLAVFIHQI